MKMAHTPAPWNVTNLDTAETVFYIGGQSGSIASAWNKGGGEGEANARLIAAAPDMLNELQYISTCIGEHPDSADYQNDEIVQINITGKGIKDLFAAIQKATKQ